MQNQEQNLNLNQKEMASKGGKARASKLTPEERRKISQKGGLNKGKKGVPRASHQGELKIGEITIPCAVVNGERLITQTGIWNAFGRNHSGRKESRVCKEIKDIERDGGELPVFLAKKTLISFISKDLIDEGIPIKFINKFGKLCQGYKATILPKICNVYLEARRKGLLTTAQLPMASAAEILASALAHVGIISLVDESTGYQDIRARDELSKILSKYISEELLPWTKRFPPLFFKEIYRLNGWKWGVFGNSKHPQCVGQFINDKIYKRLPPGVLEELREKNPVQDSGKRAHCHHQFLTDDVGNKHLSKQIACVTTLMRVSRNREEFTELFERAAQVREGDLEEDKM